MRQNRTLRRLITVAAAAMISAGVAAPVALGQYGEELPGISTSGGGGVGGNSSQDLLAKCIAKAQTKFGDNKPKRKSAIRKCRKKYGH